LEVSLSRSGCSLIKHIENYEESIQILKTINSMVARHTSPVNRRKEVEGIAKYESCSNQYVSSNACSPKIVSCSP